MADIDFEEGQVLKTGYFSKRGGYRNKGFKKRYFTLSMEGFLSYRKEPGSKILGIIDLNNMIKMVDADPQKNNLAPYVMAIICLDRIWELQFETDNDLNSWMDSIRTAVVEPPVDPIFESFLMIHVKDQWHRFFVVVYGWNMFAFTSLDQYMEWNHRFTKEKFNPISTAISNIHFAYPLKKCRIEKGASISDGYEFSLDIVDKKVRICTNSKRERGVLIKILNDISVGDFSSATYVAKQERESFERIIRSIVEPQQKPVETPVQKSPVKVATPRAPPDDSDDDFPAPPPLPPDDEKEPEKPKIEPKKEPPPKPSDDWETAFDPASGAKYYYNISTGQSKWAD